MNQSSLSTKNRISTIIVNYNSSRNCINLIKSLNKINDLLGEIIIIDNNSQDIKILENNLKNKKIRIIKNKINYGFAKAVNQGIKHSSFPIILLINPDSYLENDSVKKSIGLIFQDKSIGIIGGKIKKPNSGQYQLTATNFPNFFTALFEFTNLKKIFPNNIFSNNFWVEKKYCDNKCIPVTSLCGAFLIFRKRINGKLNKFDENYFLYMEDIDFGIFINKLNNKVIFDPRSSVTHIGGGSNNSKYKIVLKYWYKSRNYFFKKHLGLIQGTILQIIFAIEEKILDFIHLIKNEPKD